MDHLADLAVFARVVELESFSAAADAVAVVEKQLAAALETESAD